MCIARIPWAHHYTLRTRYINLSNEYFNFNVALSNFPLSRRFVRMVIWEFKDIRFCMRSLSSDIVVRFEIKLGSNEYSHLGVEYGLMLSRRSGRSTFPPRRCMMIALRGQQPHRRHQNVLCQSKYYSYLPLFVYSLLIQFTIKYVLQETFCRLPITGRGSQWVMFSRIFNEFYTCVQCSEPHKPATTPGGFYPESMNSWLRLEAVSLSHSRISTDARRCLKTLVLSHD